MGREPLLQALGTAFWICRSLTLPVEYGDTDRGGTRRYPGPGREVPDACAHEKDGSLTGGAQSTLMNFTTESKIYAAIYRYANSEMCLCGREELLKAINYYYSEVGARRAAAEANRRFGDQVIEEVEMDEEGDDDTPIINLLSRLVNRVYNTNASDIHIEPFEDKTVVRMRIDGVIVEYVTLQKSLHASVIARIKILGDMDIAERRIPQDGHFRTKIEGEYVNIRVSVIPTVFGEKAVLRLLTSNANIDYPKTFGMEESDYLKLEKMLQSPNGIIYFTGPTGSGKTTTLYMILEEISRRPVNITTIEDPVEKNLPKVNQMQVNNQAGLTFEAGLRALLRQDPDVIMVGETRDVETASISVRAAITGHLVFSTLHTNDAAVIQCKRWKTWDPGTRESRPQAIHWPVATAQRLG
ncbi:MAG: GspE/PulE family protein [[Clostridium] scindens]